MMRQHIMRIDVKRHWYVALALPLMLMAVVSFQGAESLKAEAPSTPVAVVTAGRLNVRSGPSVAYPVIDVADQGEQLTLLGRNADVSWVQIALTGGGQGWVGTRYLAPSIPLSDLPVTGQTEPYGVVGTSALNLRAGPGYQYNVLRVVYYGQGVSLLGRNADASWIWVKLPDGTEGWLGSLYLLSSVPLSSLPLTAEVVETPAGEEPVVVLPSGGAVQGTVGESSTTATATVTTGALNVRAGPGIGYEVRGVAYQGEVLTLVGRNQDVSWIEVQMANGVQGWVGNTYIRPNMPLDRLPVSGTSRGEPVATVATGALNVRAGPGIAYDVVGVAKQYQQVNLLGRSGGGWVLIRVSGVEGWVNAAYLDTSAPLGTLPLVTVP
jgi:N-acetylmuramoyl-L-alanine amidase